MRKLLGLVFAFVLLVSFAIFKKEDPTSPKMYDCFLFFNEFELLKIRLREMSPYIDKFVLVEATETFRGDPKPLYFAENKHLFDTYKDKITHVIVEGHYPDDARFHRERFQRNQIMRGLKECKNSDIILISDVDEIVRTKELPKIPAVLSSGKVKKVLCYQKMYMFYLNRFKSLWPGTAALTFKELCRTYSAQPSLLRKKRMKDHPFILENSGWHFTYMGGIEQMLKKISAYSHIEVDTPESRASFIKQFQTEQPLEPIDRSFPTYVLENQAQLTADGWIDS